MQDSNYRLQLVHCLDTAHVLASKLDAAVETAFSPVPGRGHSHKLALTNLQPSRELT